MAYREVGMWEILNILKRYGRRETIAGIHRATGHRRKTIRRYIDLAEEMGWVRGEHEPDEVLATEVARLVKPGPRGDQAGEAEQKLLPHLAQIETWLTPQHEQRRGLRLTKVHRLLERLGVTVPYSSLHRFAVKHCGFADKRRWTVRMAETAPGEVAQVDYGYLGLVPEPDTGRRRKLYALIVTLVYSRHQYVHVTHSQTVAALVDGLEEAWEFFGGVTRRVIVDNLKAAVIKPDRYDPTFQRVLRGVRRSTAASSLTPPSRAHPKGKPHVERAVPYVREDFFRGEQWLGRDHVQREAILLVSQSRRCPGARHDAQGTAGRFSKTRSRRCCSASATRRALTPPTGRSAWCTPTTTSASARRCTRYRTATCTCIGASARQAQAHRTR